MTRAIQLMQKWLGEPHNVAVVEDLQQFGLRDEENKDGAATADAQRPAQMSNRCHTRHTHTRPTSHPTSTPPACAPVLRSIRSTSAA